MSVSTTSEALVKLYLPQSQHRVISFHDLIDFNSKDNIPGFSGVHCAKCGDKTAHSSRREYHSALVFFEIIRISRENTNWFKNSIPIDFPLNGVVVLPGSDRKYRVIGTCNHYGQS